MSTAFWSLLLLITLSDLSITILGIGINYGQIADNLPPPSRVSLLLQSINISRPNSGTVDPGTNLKYDNMLYAQIDAVYSAIKVMGHNDVQVQISETGWPSKGDSNEVGATPENAGIYNRNLMQRILLKQGTPAKPSVPIDIYVFALFNENLKPGPTSERNYGLFFPDGTPVYNIGYQGFQNFNPRMNYSGCNKNGLSIFALLLFCLAFIFCAGKL